MEVLSLILRYLVAPREWITGTMRYEPTQVLHTCGEALGHELGAFELKKLIAVTLLGPQCSSAKHCCRLAIRCAICCRQPP